MQANKAGNWQGEFVAARIAAVILAAGLSRRMGRPKMVLPWGGQTVISRVVQVLLDAGVDEIVAVVGGARQQVENALAGQPVRTVLNRRFREEDMTVSLQTGLRSLPADVQACLVVLGDQPQIEPGIVTAVVQAYASSGANLVIPSYQKRRGHPWLVARPLWEAILALPPSGTLRDFINHHANQIHYLNVDNPSVLKDLDTPEDYEREQPGSGPSNQPESG